MGSRVASSNETSTTASPCSAAMRPKRPSWARSAAFSPKRVARMRSRGVGVPPRWTCPSTETRVSKPVRCSISRARRRRRRRGRRGRTGRWLALLPRRAAARPIVRQLVALADDDDREVLPARVALDELLAGVLHGDRLLGDEDHVRAACDSAHDRDPAGVPAHDLDDHDAVVRLGGRVKPVDRLGGDRRRPCRSRTCSRCPRGRCRSSSARRRLGTRARGGGARPRRACPRRRSRRARRAARSRSAARTASTPPSTLYGFVRRRSEDRPASREDPRHLAPAEGAKTPSVRPLQPSRTPTISCPRSVERRTTARITALSPGQSPPPVRIPIRMRSSVSSDVWRIGLDRALRALPARRAPRPRPSARAPRPPRASRRAGRRWRACRPARRAAGREAPGADRRSESWSAVRRNTSGSKSSSDALEVGRLGDAHDAFEAERVRLVPQREVGLDDDRVRGGSLRVERGAEVEQRQL